MAKRGQHNDNAHDRDTSKGHNNPSKSMTITAISSGRSGSDSNAGPSTRGH